MLRELDQYSKIAFIVVLVGGILWGLAGLLNLYLADILGNVLGRLLYLVVGVAAGWLCYQIYLEKMPPKSTYFYPKLLTGLVFNSLKTN